MKLDKFIIPLGAGLLIGSVVFDKIWAENIYHDPDIKISPHFSRVVASGKTHFFVDDGRFKSATADLSCKDYNPFEKDRVPPDHRLTLEDDMDLQFIINADDIDPVIFILSKKGEAYCIQRSVEKSEEFHSTSIWQKNMPHGSYLVWIGNRHRQERASHQDETNYTLIIEEDE